MFSGFVLDNRYRPLFIIDICQVQGSDINGPQPGRISQKNNRLIPVSCSGIQVNRADNPRNLISRIGFNHPFAFPFHLQFPIIDLKDNTFAFQICGNKRHRLPDVSI